MKILILSLALAIFYLGEEAYALTFEDQFHERLMEIGWKQSLLELDRYSSNEQRYILGRALHAFGSDQIPRDPARQESLEKAQSVLLATPGHAKYYQDKIESLHAEVLADSKLSQEERMKMQDAGKSPTYPGDYEDFRSSAFPVLGLLPSSESVAVLGHFLNDPEGLDGNNMFGRRIAKSDFVPYPANAGAAVIALRKLGIERPPIPTSPYAGSDDYETAEVDAWKGWWNEVKDGKRTYRLIGSPIEYGPDGPASKEAIQRTERNQKRDAERSADHKKATAITEPASLISQISKPSTIAGILAACALVAAAGWYFLRGRKAV